MDYAYDNSKPGTQIKVRASDLLGYNARYKRQYSCVLCGEPVGFFEGEVQKAHFRHKSGSLITKTCKLYAGNLSEYSDQLRRKIFGLPFYLKQIGDAFKLYLGFWPIDQSLLAKEIQREQKVTIRNTKEPQIGIVDLANIHANEVYRLPISWVYDSYELRYEISRTDLTEEWGKKIPGIFSNGMFFRIRDDYSRSISLNGVVTTNTEYYLLSQHPVTSRSFLEVKESCSLLAQNPQKWKIYKIEFTKITDEAARYAREHHVQLLEKPPEIIPLWPPSIQDSRKYIHQNTGLSTYRLNSPHESGKWEVTILDKYETPCDRLEIYLQDPIFSIKVDNGIRHLSFFDTDNDLKITLIAGDNKMTIPYQQPILELKWMNQPIEPRIELKAIKNADLSVKSDMVCDIILMRNHIPNLVFRNELSKLSLPDTSNGDTVIITHGLDILASLFFKKNGINSDYKISTKITDDALYQKLLSLGGTFIAVPTQLKYLATKLENYPRTREYLRKGLIAGKIPNKAAEHLTMIYKQGGL